MTTILAWFVKDPVTRGAGAAALVALIAVCGYLEVQVLAKEHRISTLETTSAAKDETIGQLRQRAASYESALSELARLSRVAEAEQDAANARAKALGIQSAKTIAALKAARVPTDCAGAAIWGAQTAKDLAKGWGE